MRGALIVVLMIILLEVTSFPAQPWWIESRLLPYFSEGAIWIKQHIPEDLSRYLEQVPLL
ncbi:MAG: hypothetical protein R3E95_15355 [Thiolinea sp.]